jgi:hypothetical protein
MAWLTFSRVEFATFSGVWIARETVAIETCAIRATSSIVAGLEVDTLFLTRLALRRHYTDGSGGQTALVKIPDMTGCKPLHPLCKGLHGH